MADARVSSADRVRKRLEQFRAQRQEQPASSAVDTSANASTADESDVTAAGDSHADVGVRGGEAKTDTAANTDLEWCVTPPTPRQLQRHLALDMS